MVCWSPLFGTFVPTTSVDIAGLHFLEEASRMSNQSSIESWTYNLLLSLIIDPTCHGRFLAALIAHGVHPFIILEFDHGLEKEEHQSKRKTAFSWLWQFHHRDAFRWTPCRAWNRTSRISTRIRSSTSIDPRFRWWSISVWSVSRIDEAQNRCPTMKPNNVRPSLFIAHSRFPSCNRRNVRHRRIPRHLWVSRFHW